MWNGGKAHHFSGNPHMGLIPTPKISSPIEAPAGLSSIVLIVLTLWPLIFQLAAVYCSWHLRSLQNPRWPEESVQVGKVLDFMTGYKYSCKNWKGIYWFSIYPTGDSKVTFFLGWWGFKHDSSNGWFKVTLKPNRAFELQRQIHVPSIDFQGRAVTVVQK